VKEHLALIDLLFLGTKVEELEKERERKQRELFKQMNEQDKAEKEKENASNNNQQNDLNNNNNNSVSTVAAGKDLDSDAKVTTPPVEVKEDLPTNKSKSSVKIASLQNDDASSGMTRRRRKKYDEDEDEGGVDFGAFETKEEEKESPVAVEPETDAGEKTEAEPEKDDMRSKLGKVIINKIYLDQIDYYFVSVIS